MILICARRILRRRHKMRKSVISMMTLLTFMYGIYPLRVHWITHITFVKPSRSVITISDNSASVQQFSSHSDEDVSAPTSAAHVAADQEMSEENLDGESAKPRTAQSNALRALKETIDFHFGELQDIRSNINDSNDKVHQTLLVLGHVNENLLYE
jgi:hypothetical protein